MDAPATRRISNEAVQILSQDQQSQDISHAANQAASQEPCVVVLNQPAQSPVADRANDHMGKCTVIPFATQGFCRRIIAGPLNIPKSVNSPTPNSLSGHAPCASVVQVHPTGKISGITPTPFPCFSDRGATTIGRSLPNTPTTR